MNTFLATEPRNAVTGEPYSGKNVAILLDAAESEGFVGHDQWAGFQQWLTVGRVVRKGQHGTHCRRVISGTDKETGKTRRGVRGFVVFHRDQTDPLPTETADEVTA